MPDMYEPVWYTEKVVTTIAEGVATVGSLLGFLYASAAARAAGTAGGRHSSVSV